VACSWSTPRSIATLAIWLGAWACAATGCEATSGGGRGPDGGSGLTSLSVRGRVVDAESCSDSTRGCQPVRGIVVAAAGAPELRSAPTGADGAFRLDGLPRGFASALLLVPQDTAGALYVPTLNPEVVPAASDVTEIFGAELYVLPRGTGSLLDAVAREAGLDLITTGGYVGQAVLETGSVPVAGASAIAYPAQGTMRFVNALPSVASGEMALLPETATTTGPFGLFLFAAGAPRESVAVVPLEDGRAFTLINARLAPGEVAFAVHYGR